MEDVWSGARGRTPHFGTIIVALETKHPDGDKENKTKTWQKHQRKDAPSRSSPTEVSTWKHCWDLVQMICVTN